MYSLPFLYVASLKKWDVCKVQWPRPVILAIWEKRSEDMQFKASP
jgi:hypothetical protein